LSPEEDSELAIRPIDDMSAHEAYVRARYEAWSFSEESLRKAQRHIENALAIVGDNELLYVTLGHIYASYTQAGVGNAADLISKAKVCADQVLTTNPNSQRGLWLRGFVRLTGGDVRNAAPDIERAYALNPHDPDALTMLAYLHIMFGRVQQAQVLVDKLIEIDPLTPISHTMPGYLALCDGRTADAVPHYAKVYQMDPVPPFHRWAYAWSLLWNRRVEEAAAIVEALVQEFPADPFSAFAESQLLGVRGDRRRAAEGITDGMRVAGRNNELFSRELVHCCALAGLIDEAIQWLENTIRIGNINYPFWAKHNRFIDSLRGNPRFEQLLDDMEREWAEKTREEIGSVERRVGSARKRSGTSLEPADGSESRTSIVVLPFANMSPSADDEYLSDGLTDELITDLSKVKSLRVIARNSSMKFKGTDKALTAVGRELGVEYVLDGSVRRAADDLRITAQLVDVADDSPIWADRYTGSVGNVFDFQEQVSRSIVSALDVELSGQEAEGLSERPIPNLVAYEHYLKARRDIFGFDRESLERASQNLTEGLAIVGENALLLRGLGLVHFQMLNAGVSEDESLINELESCSLRIKQLDPGDPGGFMLSGLANVLRGDGRRAVVDLTESYRRNPSDPDAMLWLAVAMLATGQPERSRVITDELVRVDPMAPLSHLLVGYTAFFQGRFDAMLAPYRRGLELGPDIPVNLWCAIRVFAAAGFKNESVAASDRLQELHAETPFAESARLFAAALEGRVEAVVDPSEELRAWAARDGEWGQYLVDAYALAGMDDRALDWLETAVDAGFLNHSFLNEHDPFIENVRGSPRFEKLMERVKRELTEFEMKLEAVGPVEVRTAPAKESTTALQFSEQPCVGKGQATADPQS
jgi:TolB-like protein/cytochrome c-type biogenesis protein CcmH/NrfG